MNKLQRTEYKAQVVDLGKWWTIVSTIIALIVSVWVVSEFRAVDLSGKVGSAAIVYLIVWTLVYLSGIVWGQTRAHRKALKL